MREGDKMKVREVARLIRDGKVNREYRAMLLTELHAEQTLDSVAAMERMLEKERE